MDHQSCWPNQGSCTRPCWVQREWLTQTRFLDKTLLGTKFPIWICALTDYQTHWPKQGSCTRPCWVQREWLTQTGFLQKPLLGTEGTTDPSRTLAQDPVGYRWNDWPKQGSCTRPCWIQRFLSKIGLFCLNHRDSFSYSGSFSSSSSKFVHNTDIWLGLFLSIQSLLCKNLILKLSDMYLFYFPSILFFANLFPTKLWIVVSSKLKRLQLIMHYVETNYLYLFINVLLTYVLYLTYLAICT